MGENDQYVKVIEDNTMDQDNSSILHDGNQKPGAAS